jgi:hypothetical protein
MNKIIRQLHLTPLLITYVSNTQFYHSCFKSCCFPLEFYIKIMFAFLIFPVPGDVLHFQPPRRVPPETRLRDLYEFNVPAYAMLYILAHNPPFLVENNNNATLSTK